MAIYHLEAKVVSRGTGRSACAASAYLSCSAIYNDYDGIQHDYTRKKGLVWEAVFLPETAPADWKDRENLWNAVEETEKTKDSRLAREFVPALPVELNPEQWKDLLTDFIENSFVSDGMCADVAIHDPDPPGHNPHAHILLTVRPLNPDGTWQYKTEKEYLCVRNGEEQGFTAAEFKTAKAEGWEKQYQYKVGKKKQYMAPSEAEAKGYVRLSKHPKSTKFGRQNPISERWNSEEQLVLWREAWANAVNRSLERYGFDERVDHRSHAARGLDEQPTVHEGVIARAMENKGVVSDRCELNRRIKQDNALLRELKSQLQKLMKKIQVSVPSIAEKLEQIRMSMLVFGYQVMNARRFIRTTKDNLAEFKPDFDRYTKVTEKIRRILKERKHLLGEKKALPPFRIAENRRISQKLAELTEDYEELKSEKEMLISRFFKNNDKEMAGVRRWIENTEAQLDKAEAADQRFTDELNNALAEYHTVMNEAQNVDPNELMEAQLMIRQDKEDQAVRKLQDSYGAKYDPSLMREAKATVAKTLHEDTEGETERSVLKRLHNNQNKLAQNHDEAAHHRCKINEQEL
ncbi:MAG: MobA/MobL family protein [Lachnospiraceae bacterium]|nr:MobA/MobL family protein [Lachnospiraceae bacterium]